MNAFRESQVGKGERKEILRTERKNTKEERKHSKIEQNLPSLDGIVFI